MVSSEVWRKLANKFREIPDPKGLLRAYWMSVDGNESFHVAGEVTAEVHELFESVANIAGIQLGGIGINDPVLSWLDALKRERGISKYGYTIRTATDGTGRKEQHEEGTIQRVCLSSAEFCEALQRKALEIESLLGLAENRTISQRLDDAALHQDISHEEQAHRVGISRAAYFEVKAGRGGRRSRRKVDLYLSSVFKNIPSNLD